MSFEKEKFLNKNISRHKTLIQYVESVRSKSVSAGVSSCVCVWVPTSEGERILKYL